MGCGKSAVAEGALDDGDVRDGEESRREGVAQHVRGQLALEDFVADLSAATLELAGADGFAAFEVGDGRSTGEPVAKVLDDVVGVGDGFGEFG